MNRIKDAETTEAPAAASDGDLLRRFLAERDDQAFADLVARHGPLVYGVAMRRLGRCQDAEDAFQAVFLALAQHAGRLAGGVTVGPWLYTVARQVCTKAVRSRRRSRWVFWGAAPEPTTKPPAEVDVDLDAALATLSEHERSAVVLCHLEGMSRAEAARALGCPEGTLSARLSRALDKLRRKLGKPPLAILAGAMLVMLPESLPASTVGLVRRLRDGALEDWASPRTLELYRKAVPMRLLDRAGPMTTAVISLALILAGAGIGWHLVTAQNVKQGSARAKSAIEPPTNRGSFAGAIDELQKKNARSSKYSLTLFSTGRIPASGGPNPADQRPRASINEKIDGMDIHHSVIGWNLLDVLLHRLASEGHTRIDIKLGSGGFDASESKHLLDICRNASLTVTSFEGSSTTQLGAKLPERPLEQFSTSDVGATKYGAGSAVNLGAQKLSELPDVETKGNPGSVNQRLDEFSRPFADPRWSGLIDRLPLVVLVLVTKSRPEPICSLHREDATESIGMSSSNANAIDLILRRMISGQPPESVAMSVGTFESPSQPSDPRYIDPLFVNRVLNNLKDTGVGRLNYIGPPIFTGGQLESDFELTALEDSAAVRSGRYVRSVNLNLVLAGLQGELPDPRNGWNGTMNVDSGWANVKGADPGSMKPAGRARISFSRTKQRPQTLDPAPAAK